MNKIEITVGNKDKVKPRNKGQFKKKPEYAKALDSERKEAAKRRATSDKKARKMERAEAKTGWGIVNGKPVDSNALIP